MNPPDEQTLRKYLLEWRTEDLYHNPGAFPRLTSEQLFGRAGPLSLEIGCSTGEYLCGLAQRNRSELFLGVDSNRKSLLAAVELGVSLGLDNIRFIKAPVQWLYPLFAPNSLHVVYIHFPDPSLHPKQRKRQILNRRLMDALHFALVPGGLLSFVTDNATLFDNILALVESDPRFRKTHSERYLEGFNPEVKSRYQLYWEQHGVPIKRVELARL